MTFKRLSEYFKLLEDNASRLKITEVLAQLFKECEQEEIDKICYLSLGRLLPSYEGLEFQMAQKMLEKAIAKAFGVELTKVVREMKDLGDLGEAGEKLKDQSASWRTKFKEQKLFEDFKDEKNLRVVGVYERLLEIAKENGEGSVERKINKMAVLLQELDAPSVRFVIRMPLGKMRMGFSEMTILDALSWMITGDKSLREKLEDAYNVVADIGEIAQRVKKMRDVREMRGLEKVEPRLGTPILPALCQRIPTAEEIIEKLGEVAVEPKYDGTRLQIHMGGVGVRIFTRNMENVTHMFPDIVEILPKEVKAKEVILDAEGVGIDPKTGKFLPFQETIKRKRKHQVAIVSKEIPFNCFVFDVLYYNGESLIKTPLEERRKILEKIISGNNKKIKLAPQIVTQNAEDLRKYHDLQIKNGLEGVVIKKWQSFYEPGRRGFNWVKLKQESDKKGGGLADTIECVVMGTYRGKGKRTDFGVGAFLVGVRKGEKYVTITKIGTGLTDEQFRELKVQSASWRTKLNKKPLEYEVDKNLAPDVWCEPKLVVEIQADNITESPLHSAGLALRFPRLIRFRDDKSAEQITTVKEVESLFKMQFGSTSFGRAELRGVNK